AVGPCAPLGSLGGPRLVPAGRPAVACGHLCPGRDGLVERLLWLPHVRPLYPAPGGTRLSLVFLPDRSYRGLLALDGLCRGGTVGRRPEYWARPPARRRTLAAALAPWGLVPGCAGVLFGLADQTARLHPARVSAPRGADGHLVRRAAAPAGGGPGVFAHLVAIGGCRGSHGGRAGRLAQRRARGV